MSQQTGIQEPAAQSAQQATQYGGGQQGMQPPQQMQQPHQQTQQTPQQTQQTPQQTQQPSQQMQQPHQQMQQPHQQMQQPHQQMQQQMRFEFDDTLTRDMRVALHDFVQSATVCNWCADECLGDPEMEACARYCRDVADLAALNVQFLSRDSIFGADLAETFAYAAEECGQICAQFPHEHCQECASVLRRATESTWAMLDSLQHVPQGGQPQQQTQIQQY